MFFSELNGEIGKVVCSNFMFVRGYVRVEPVRLVHSEPWEKVEPNMGKCGSIRGVN